MKLPSNKNKMILKNKKIHKYKRNKQMNKNL